jgi:sugar O-acyltransferase (sialic acid O-acetyltransferase NeuD family)
VDPQRSIKYAFDRFAASLLLLLTAPLLAAIAIAIRIDSPGSPLFLQERIGAGGRAFTIFKFRTMRSGREHDGLGVSTAPGDDRITRVGRWLRATSLDELPQLLNIVLGEMSFIGPRPTLRYQVEAYSPRQQRRLLFRPGITGWAQIHGRNTIPWSERIELDVEYVERFSLGLDLRILWRTLRVVGRGDGVYAASGTNDAFVAPAAAPTQAASPVLYPAPTVTARLPLLLIGAGGHARVLIDVAERQGRFQIHGLLDERPRDPGATLMGYPILGGRERLDRRTLPSHAIVAIGSPSQRAAWQEALEELGFQLAVLVHPSAQIGRDVELGAGSVVMAQVAVNSGTRVGRGAILNTGASIDHDCELGDFVHVAPGARLAGGVRVGARAHIGIGSCVIQNLAIGSHAVVGAGAAVVRSVDEGAVVGGVPARLLRTPVAAAATRTSAPPELATRG